MIHRGITVALLAAIALGLGLAGPVAADEKEPDWGAFQVGDKRSGYTFAIESTRAMQDRMPHGCDAAEAVFSLRKRYEGRGVNVVRVGDAWAIRTAPDLSFLMSREQVETRKLSRAAIETLAIVAYHQPCTRAEIEEIRGISLSRGTIDILLELGWIKPRGRRRTPGRPLTWGTSPAFLDHFGLAEIADLPGLDDLKAAGLLRKGQILGAMMEHNADDLDIDADEIDEDLLEDSLLEAGLDGDNNAEL